MTSRQERCDLGPLADFMAEDILSTPGRQLVDELTEDCGDPEAFASAFDKIVQDLDPLLPHWRRSSRGIAIRAGRNLARSIRSRRRILTVLGHIVFPNRLRMATRACAALVMAIVAAIVAVLKELRS
jgi:hypothetical protein